MFFLGSNFKDLKSMKHFLTYRNQFINKMLEKSLDKIIHYQ